MTTSPLTLLERVLKEEDFATFLMPVDEDNLFERLFVSLGQDDENRDFTLQIHFINDVTNALGVDDDPEDAFLLQFFLLLPYDIPKYQTSEVSRVILTLNRILPIGSFGLSEDDGLAYFQYNLACAERIVDEKVLREIVSIIGFFSSEFSNRIEQAAEGKITRNSLIQELAQGGIQFPSLKGMTEETEE